MATPPLDVLYEDNHCLAVAKPCGWASAHFQGRDATLDQAAKAYLKAKYGKPGNVFLGVVHRLDRPVSGVLLFARTSKAAARLAEQFREGTIEKVYWAVVEGDPGPGGTLEDWLLKDRGIGRVRVVPRGTPAAARAVLRFVRRHVASELAWLEVRSRTGRRHQIRVQLAHRGHPVYGDTKYGSRHAFGRGIALHARALIFRHPVRDEPVTLVAEPPAAWGRFPWVRQEARP